MAGSRLFQQPFVGNRGFHRQRLETVVSDSQLVSVARFENGQSRINLNNIAQRIELVPLDRCFYRGLRLGKRILYAIES